MIRKVKDFGPDLANRFPSLDENALYGRKYIGGAMTKESSEKDGEYGQYTSTGYVTTLDIDRDRDVLMPKGIDWTEYEKNNVVLNMHRYRERPLGQCVKLIPDSLGWKGVTQYFVNEAKNSEGYKNWEYRNAGFPMGRSIGFAPTEYAINSKYGEEFEKGWKDAFEEWQKQYKAHYGKKPKGTPDIIYTKSIAFEYSDVTVPANPGCNGEEGKEIGIDLISVSKGLGINGKISVDTLIELKSKMLSKEADKVSENIDDGENMKIKEILEKQQEQIDTLTALLAEQAIKKALDTKPDPDPDPELDPESTTVLDPEPDSDDQNDEDEVTVEDIEKMLNDSINTLIKDAIDKLKEEASKLQDKIAKTTGKI